MISVDIDVGYIIGKMFTSKNFHQVLRLRIHRAIPPLPQYVFMAWYLTKQEI